MGRGCGVKLEKGMEAEARDEERDRDVGRKKEIDESEGG